MMNSPLGKLQFQKKAETVFSISSGNSPDAACSGKNEEIRDSDGCICSNYGDKQMKQKVCCSKTNLMFLCIMKLCLMNSYKTLILCIDLCISRLLGGN